MAYSHASQIAALRDMGVDAVLLGSDDWMLGSLTTIPRVAVFQGTSGPARRIRRGFAYLASLARLLRLIRRHRPDVVHWQNLELPIADLGAMLAIRLMGVAEVYTVRDLLP
jgi:Glycosyltransferase Family 4